MEPLARLDSNSILAEDIFLEIFDQEDEIMKARMILSLTDRAAELGVKKKFEELLKAYKKVDREAKQRERKKPIAMLDKWTNFEGPYNNMFCGAWILFLVSQISNSYTIQLIHDLCSLLCR